MSACENILFIKCKSIDHKEKIVNILSNGIKLFESFIILEGTKLECYGTSSDVYIEYINVELFFDELLIKLTFTTYETPPLHFCKSISFHYNIDVQLLYFNEENNYSGKLCITNNKITCDQIFNYYQGLYENDKDRFWEEIEKSFEFIHINEKYEDYIKKNNFNLTSMDYSNLKRLFDQYLLLKNFERM